MTHKNEKPIVFVPRTLANPEKSYRLMDKEEVSIIFGSKYFFKNIYSVENLQTLNMRVCFLLIGVFMRFLLLECKDTHYI